MEGCRFSRPLALLMIVTLLPGGCGNPEETATTLPPVSIEQGDECHVCLSLIHI